MNSQASNDQEPTKRLSLGVSMPCAPGAFAAEGPAPRRISDIYAAVYSHAASSSLHSIFTPFGYSPSPFTPSPFTPPPFTPAATDLSTDLKKLSVGSSPCGTCSEDLRLENGQIAPIGTPKGAAARGEIADPKCGETAKDSRRAGGVCGGERGDGSRSGAREKGEKTAGHRFLEGEVYGDRDLNDFGFLIVTHLVKTGAADIAGLCVGDIFVNFGEFDKTNVKDLEALYRYVVKMPNDVVSVVVLRSCNATEPSFKCCHLKLTPKPSKDVRGGGVIGAVINVWPLPKPIYD